VVTHFEFTGKISYGSKTRVSKSANSEDLVILACTVFDWFTRVTDGQRDRQTDRQNRDG